MIQENSLNEIFNKSHLFTTRSNNVVINEPDQNARVRRVTITNQNVFLSINTELIKDIRSLFNNNHKILKLEADGVVVFEFNNEKYIYIIELKSTYNSQDIYKAKNQIISTYIKLNILLNVIQPFKKENYIFKGFIVALAPNTEKINGMSKLSECGHAKFAYKLCTQKSVDVRFEKTEAKDIPINRSCCFDVLNINFIGADSEEVDLDTLKYL